MAMGVAMGAVCSSPAAHREGGDIRSRGAACLALRLAEDARARQQGPSAHEHRCAARRAAQRGGGAPVQRVAVDDRLAAPCGEGAADGRQLAPTGGRARGVVRAPRVNGQPGRARVSERGAP